MNAPLDTLAFAKSFEDVGFDHHQAHAMAAALDKTHEASRDDVITRDVLKSELAELKVELVREIASVGRDISSRLWSTVTIIAEVSTAISATIGAGVALLLHAKGI